MGAVRTRFYVALGLFAAWVIGLGVMAYTSAEKPRDPESLRRPK